MSMGSTVGKLIVKLIGDDSHYRRTLKRAQEQTMKWGTRMTAAVTAPIAGMGALAVREFAGFDQAMTESLSIMKTTEEQTKRMQQTALNLSKNSVKGPRELAESYYFLASAGLDAEKSMGALPIVTRFATAGAFDMAKATDLLTDAQTALGIEMDASGENMSNLGDHIVLAARQANASVQQFSESITADAGVAARNFGADVETTMAILGAYASSGKKGAEAGNLMGRAFRLLTKANQENGEAFKKYGIDVVDQTTGEFRNFIDIIGDMEESFEGLTKPEISRRLEDLGFAALAQKSILPLIGMTDQMKKWEIEQKSAAGTMKEVEEKQLQSFTNQWKLLLNAVKVAAIEIGSTIAPALAKVREWLVKAMEAWDQLEPSMKRNIVVIAGIAAAIGPLLIALSGVLAVVGALTSPLGLIVVAIGAITTAIVYNREAIGEWLGGWDNVIDKLMFVWKTAQVIFDNWYLIIDIFVNQAILKFMSWYNDIHFMFTQQLPAIAGLIPAAFGAAFRLIIHNGKATMKALMDILAARGIRMPDLKWNVMQDEMFAEAMRNIPSLAEREMGALEKQQQQYIKSRQQQLQANIEKAFGENMEAKQPKTVDAEWLMGMYGNVKGFASGLWDGVTEIGKEGLAGLQQKAMETNEAMAEVFTGPNSAVRAGDQEFYDLLAKVKPATEETPIALQPPQTTEQRQLTLTEQIQKGITDLVKLTQKIANKPEIEVEEVGLS
jgi:TP901 family phage tail tape measure protein